MGWHYGDWTPLGGVAMSLIMLAFWAFLIWVILVLVRGRASHDGDASRTDDPITILDRRFAAGEIEEVEYQHRLNVLAGRSREGPPT